MQGKPEVPCSLSQVAADALGAPRCGGASWRAWENGHGAGAGGSQQKPCNANCCVLARCAKRHLNPELVGDFACQMSRLASCRA